MRTSLLLAFLFAFGMATSKAQAAVSVEVGVGVRAPAVVVESGGYYETREETVLVEPAHTEQVWVPSVYKYETDEDGNTVKILVKKGYYKEVYVPARYETRIVRVWVPCAPVVVERPAYGGFFFSWSDRHHGHHH